MSACSIGFPNLARLSAFRRLSESPRTLTLRSKLMVSLPFQGVTCGAVVGPRALPSADVGADFGLMSLGSQSSPSGAAVKLQNEKCELQNAIGSA